MTTPIIVKQQVRDDVIRLDSGRRLDNDNAMDMSEAISECQASGFKYVIVDMTNLEFISSSGVGSILGGVELQRQQGGDIILCNVAEPVMSVLRVLDLDEYLTFKPNVEVALADCT